MPRRNTIRNRVLKEFAEDEVQPERCRLFRHAFIAQARNLSAAGITSNSELAIYFKVSAATVGNWKKQFPRFLQSVEGGAIELVSEMVDRAVDIARGGDAQMIRYLLDRRADAFRPKSKLEHSLSADTLDERLKRRAMSENEARERGLIFDVDDDGDRLPYAPEDFEDEPLVKQIATPAQPQRRRETTEADLRRRGVLYGEDDGRSGITVDPKRPYDFEKGRDR